MFSSRLQTCATASPISPNSSPQFRLGLSMNTVALAPGIVAYQQPLLNPALQHLRGFQRVDSGNLAYGARRIAGADFCVRIG